MNERMLAWPGTKRLASLTGAEGNKVRGALRLLEERKAIEQTHNSRKAWRILMASDEKADNPNPRVRVFWPEPCDRTDNDQTKAFRALFAALGNRNRVAVIFLLYQFARWPELPDCLPIPPNYTWVAGVLGTSVSTVFRAKDDAIDLGIAAEGEDGLLTFEDPGSWSEILHGRNDSSDAAAVTPTAHIISMETCSIPDSSMEKAPQGSEPSSGPPAPSPSSHEEERSISPAANMSDYPSSSGDMHAVDPIACIEQVLRAAGWALPSDVLAHEILMASIRRIGIEETISRLCTELTGPYPSYALEPLGSALGEEYECPHQLITYTSSGAEKTA